MSLWKWTGQHAFIVDWRGVLVNVECNSEPDEGRLIMYPVRVLTRDADITPLVDIESRELQELVQYAYDYDGHGRADYD